MRIQQRADSRVGALAAGQRRALPFQLVVAAQGSAPGIGQAPTQRQSSGLMRRPAAQRSWA